MFNALLSLNEKPLNYLDARVRLKTLNAMRRKRYTDNESLTVNSIDFRLEKTLM